MPRLVLLTLCLLVICAPHATRAADDLAVLESYGLPPASATRALPADLWRGTSYSRLQSQLSATPPVSSLPALTDLLRRTLTSAQDARLIKDRPPSSSTEGTGAHDLITARIDKLIDMGLFADAAALYLEIPNRSTYPALSYNGIIALLLKEDTALACLESFAAQDSLARHPHGADLVALCRHVSGFPASKALESDNKDLSSSIKRIMAGTSYKFKPSTFDQIAQKDRLDIALLKATGYFDTGKITKTMVEKADSTLSPFILGLLRYDHQGGADRHFSLLIRAVTNGLATPEELGTFYLSQTDTDAGTGTDTQTNTEDKSTNNAEEDWHILARLYQELPNKQKTGETLPLLQQALSYERQYGPAVLSPFAAFLADITPKQLESSDLTAAALHTAAFAGIMLPYTWAESWQALIATDKQKDILTALAAQSALLLPARTKNQPFDFTGFLNIKSEDTQNIAKIIYETLDTDKELHNIQSQDIFSNVPDLTYGEGYVITSDTLVKNLEQAGRDGRKGEVVLLSVQALHDASSNQNKKINGDTLREVLHSLVSVGLEKEAQKIGKNALDAQIK